MNQINTSISVSAKFRNPNKKMQQKHTQTGDFAKNPFNPISKFDSELVPSLKSTYLLFIYSRLQTAPGKNLEHKISANAKEAKEGKADPYLS
ncbi:unnamed protein product [Linum trigynum]|uniref:Uncharacterized protein n=1 Tax=Linum trigynum TaxID=586398 RepID=A0AAV2EEU2_9ROSI